ncbi:MAG: DUF1592 domain-containing protein [Polyangiaceae bacterium]
MRRSTWTLMLATLFGAGVACTGVVEDPASGKSKPGFPGGGGQQPQDGDVGRVTIHRLNRVEYNNTVRDLFGTSLRPADDFPADDHGYGFDNIADVLSVSPSQLELYERAADLLLAESLALPTPDAELSQVEAETLSGSVGAATANGWNLWANGEVSTTFSLPNDGRYVVSARVWQQAAGPDAARATLSIGSDSLGTFDVNAGSDAPQVISGEAQLSGGSKVVSVRFENDFYDEASGADRNLYVDWLQVEGPFGTSAPSNAQRDAIVPCDIQVEGEKCARQVLTDFGKRAWRRPLTVAEVDQLMGLYQVAVDEGQDPNTGLTLALKGLLLSSQFIFRVELDPDPASLEPHPLGQYELASRLSYFLWSSTPDDELLKAADDGLLSDQGTLEQQVRRMLSDPRSSALVENFAGQWLFIRALDAHEPDTNYFGDYDDALRESLRQEMQLFFEDFLRENRPITELLTAKYSYLDQRLARHYGVQTSGAGFQRIDFGDESGGGTVQRGGLLRQAGLLTVTSYPTRTSPVKRGKWVLEQLLCSAPPPPPSDVVTDITSDDIAGKTLREVLEAHRANPDCAVCHDAMDPIGLAFENFNGIGAYRSMENGKPIDPTGQLPDGTQLTGASDLVAAVAADPRYVGCVAEKLFTYGLGRGPKKSDRTRLANIVEAAGGEQASLESLILGIVTSDAFRMRRGEEQL